MKPQLSSSSVYIAWEVCVYKWCVMLVSHLCALPFSPRAAVPHGEPQCRLRPDSASGRRSRLWELHQRAQAQQERADEAGHVLNYSNGRDPYWALAVQDSSAGRLPPSWSSGTGSAPAESEEELWRGCCLFLWPYPEESIAQYINKP